MTRIVILVGALLFGAQIAHADPPELKTLLPSGAQRGQTVEVTINGKLGTAPVRGWCSRDGVTMTVPEKGSKCTVSIPADAEPGLCWIRLVNAEGASALRPFVIGTLPEVLDKEPNNGVENAQTLPATQVVVNGALAASGDVDVFAVPLKGGETLVAAVAANSLLGSPMDAVLQVVSPRGFVLLQNDDARGFDPQLNYTATEEGTHYVRIFAFPAAPNSSIRLAAGKDYIYRLTITNGPFVDHAFPMSVKRGETGSFELQGWNLTESLRQLTVPADAVGESLTVQHPELANTLDVRVDELPALSEPQRNADAPAEITLPVAVTGRIAAPGEKDVYAFDAKKGDNLSSRVDARAIGQELDAVLELRDAAGKVLKRVDDPKRNEFDAVLEQTIPQDGRYVIAVSDLFGHGGMRYAYRLTVENPQPDFRVSAEADAFKLTPGTPLKIPVTVARENGFSGDIEITAVELPEGVSTTAVMSEAKDKETSKKVELVLTAAAEVVIDGRFRIIAANGEAEEKMSRTATAPITGLTATTTDLWLTVLKPAEKK